MLADISTASVLEDYAGERLEALYEFDEDIGTPSPREVLDRLCDDAARSIRAAWAAKLREEVLQ